MGTTTLLDATTNLAALKAGEIDQQYRDLVRQVATATGEKGPTPEVILKTLLKLGRTEATFRRDVERLANRIDLRARYDRRDAETQRRDVADAKYRTLWAAYQAAIADLEAKFEAEAAPLRDVYDDANKLVQWATNAEVGLRESVDPEVKRLYFAASDVLRRANEEVARLERGTSVPDRTGGFVEDTTGVYTKTIVQRIEGEIKDIRDRQHGYALQERERIAYWMNIRDRDLADAEKRLEEAKLLLERDRKLLAAAKVHRDMAALAMADADAAFLVP